MFPKSYMITYLGDNPNLDYELTYNFMFKTKKSFSKDELVNYLYAKADPSHIEELIDHMSEVNDDNKKIFYFILFIVSKRT